ncbi:MULTISPECIES: hypothetical protein [unclassified Campylobacter]|uniref:hypothetical protein n=1 Tax=unclassified Campylobacter TaxID=2593542 RepID=UPI0012382D0C|nr:MULTISPECIES: hypothetical protein [unclassified Campylobacter]KAA6224999.1 hypothetical protein FMM55_08360 [Campylobacter sp. LR196d]KAA6225321.1 hypothetical protein FMM57_08040 [Campylobacter sp. LR286c]KAA6225560.1 hypothetical protein FMM54_05880 [Campylobacter sp. LR185c]KAA6230446.1 hypothetical protein FMM58_05530 [Campylobacter sp. LR291e]KAA6230528.1 hypothetical protein FMM56_05905 [Campylobacter sp. LR264d]
MKDKYELDLDEKKEHLKQCQEEKNFKSCYNCESIFNCLVRKNFVDAVYASMSKGKTGGFDF